MTATGEISVNRYGEPTALTPFGLEANGVTIPTRKRWEIVQRPVQDPLAAARDPMASENPLIYFSPLPLGVLSITVRQRAAGLL